MTRIEANAYLAIILETVAELTPKGGAPSGPIYAALMGRMSLDEYQALINIAVGAGLFTEQGHCFSITDLGRTMVAKIAAHRALKAG